MKYVYTIYDSVAKEAGPLFIANNDDVAVRNFQNLLVHERVNEEQIKDYILVKLGEFEPEQPVLFGKAVPDFLDSSREVEVDE